MVESLYLKQMEIGPMQNFVYLIGSQQSREVAVVDPAWEVERVVEAARQDGMEITKVLITHTHPDHVGGSFAGMHIQGVAQLLELVKAKVYIHKSEAEFLKELSASDLVKVEGGEKITVGEIGITLIHTPGHTPGSQCFLVDNRLVSGDTLFIGSCGRVDLPGSNPEDMYYSLTTRLMRLADDTVLYPGHNYADRPTSTLGDEKRHNMFMRFPSLREFLTAMGY